MRRATIRIFVKASFNPFRFVVWFFAKPDPEVPGNGQNLKDLHEKAPG